MSLPAGFRIRTLELKDIDAVVEIEREAFTTPWQPETFAGLMEREGVELIVMTAPPDERVVGYAVLWCVLDQGELANIAIAPEERGAGLGTHLLRHVLDVGGRRGVHRVFLEVRASNRRAISLYRSFAFVQDGLRKGYYPCKTGREDALLMSLEL